MSINGFNPNLFMSTMAPTQSASNVQNQPVSLLANPAQQQNTSMLSNAALDTSNPMNALGQLFSMLATLLTQLFSGLGSAAPAQNQTPVNNPVAADKTATNTGNTGSANNNSLNSMAQMLQDIIANLSEDESSPSTSNNVAKDATSYDTGNNYATDTSNASDVSYNTDSTSDVNTDEETVAADTGTEEPAVTTTTNAGDGSVVTTTTNDAGRDIKNVSTTISDSGNTYNITIQMQPKGKGRTEDRDNKNNDSRMHDRGDRNKPGQNKPATDSMPAYNQSPPPASTPVYNKPPVTEPPAYNQAPPPPPPVANYNMTPPQDNGYKPAGGNGSINNNTTNINNGNGTINNNTTNINGGAGDINNNTTNINEGNGDINNNDTNINEGAGDINNNTYNLNEGNGTINNNTTNINGAEDCEPTPPPPVEEECPPPPPPSYEDGNDSQYYGDPHFVGFGGEKYDVMGEVGKTYNILSDKGLQYNAEFAAWGNPDANGVQPTVINKAGITSGKDQIQYELNGGAPILNGSAMESGKDYSLDANGKANWDGSKMHFENGEYSIDLSQDPANKDAILSNVKVRDGVNPLADGVNPDGLLGQTADGVKGERVGKNADGTEKTDKSSKQGGTVIDGDHTDYQVANLLDTSFAKHNQFVA